MPVVAGGATVVTALLRKYETDKTTEELPDQLTVRQLVCKNVIHLNSSSSTTNKANENNIANDKEKDDDKDNGMPHQRIRTMYSQMSCTRKTQATNNNNNQNNITLTTNETTSRATNKPNERTNDCVSVSHMRDGRTYERVESRVVRKSLTRTG